MNNYISPNELDRNLLSYGRFLQDLKNWKSSGGRYSDEFNEFDSQDRLYFKLVFYFFNGNDDELTGLNTGLLAPSWIGMNDDDMSRDGIDFQDITSAYAYLRVNGEKERARNLRQFIELLSNISAKSPWYFQKVAGLGEALTRNVKDAKYVTDERKKISINCLADPYDKRIATLLDLYRSVVWSWKHKRFVLPPNLRKFDMGLYIFSAPVTNIHMPETDPATLDRTSSDYVTSYKYIEFKNCEIEYNSTASGLDNLDNAEGFASEYNIDIWFDDVYEERFNEFTRTLIGDMVACDALVSHLDGSNNAKMGDIESVSAQIGTIEELNRRINEINPLTEDELVEYEPEGGDERSNSRLVQAIRGLLPKFNKPSEPNPLGKLKNYPEQKTGNTGFVSNMVGDVVAQAKKFVKEKAMGVWLGNIYTFSAKSAVGVVSGAMSGHVLETIKQVQARTRRNYNGNKRLRKNSIAEEGFDGNTELKDKANIFKANTMISNI